ncbi:hypothetical protein WDV85_15075 [Pseudokineococcus sp. 5B2Z-1]|uniref:hypothetical protein n=1 Tax=Pseudokineococcus sp. 5B2Z-1 TaxID=3132744 RepID=UPI0030B3748C
MTPTRPAGPRPAAETAAARGAGALVGARALVVLLGVLAVLLGAPGAAQAHGGPIVVDVAGDGAGGLTLVATWREDGHPVGPEVEFTGRATGPEGRVVDDIAFELLPEGEAFRAAPAVLPAGEWTVELRASEGSDETFEAVVTSTGLPTPTPTATEAAEGGASTTAAPPSAEALPPAGGGEAATDVEPLAGVDAAADDGGGGAPVGLLVGALVAAVLVVAGAVVLRRRARHPTG